jgi:hypothetical protein
MKKYYEEVINIKNKLRGVFQKIGLSLLVLVFSIHVMAQSTQKVSLNVKNVELSNALDALQKQTKLHIVYNHEYVNALPKISLTVKNQPLNKVLEQLLDNSGLSVVFRGNTILVGPKQEKSEGITQKTKLISGFVIDEHGDPLQRATVRELNTNNGTVTDEKGHFQLKVADEGLLLVSCLGMEGQRIAIGGKTSFKIQMKSNSTDMNEVVVTGIPFVRKAESFTGAVTKITAQELQRAGSLNIFQSLKNIEPSFKHY